MSDIGVGDAGAGDAGDAGDAGVAAALSGGDAPAAGDVFDDPAVQQFDRTYVEKLRKEAADRRTAVKTYEDHLGDFEESDRSLWLGLSKELASALKSGDKSRITAAAGKLDEVAKGLRGETPPAPTADDKPKDEPKYMTEADFDRRQAERDARLSIESKVKDLGYTPGTSDHRELLWIAANETKYDLDAAHAKLEERNQAIFDRMAGKKTQVSGGPSPVTDKGSSPSGERKIKNLKDADAAAKEFFKNAK